MRFALSTGRSLRNAQSLLPVLVGLYEEPERPPNAVEYVKKFIGAPQQDDVAAIKAENQRLLEELNQVKSAFQELNAKIAEDGRD